MAEFFDISNWHEKPWYQTGGTRSKVIVENPANRKDYYFKTSLKKELKDYKYEFWSEIIASEVGNMLGFNMLKYDIAYKGNEIGCISESMITEGKNKLTEGVSYLTGYDINYNPKHRDSKKQYSFQLIRNTLAFYKLDRFIDNIIELIIFDSIIGNGDRHQENWGIITEYNEVIKSIEILAKKDRKSFLERQIFSLLKKMSKIKKNDIAGVVKDLQLIFSVAGEFSPIYDSGSSLGREKEDDKIIQLNKDAMMLDAYIRRGDSEIHWEGEKLNHFDLIEKLNKDYPEIVRKTIAQVKSNYEAEGIRSIVEVIDAKLPQHLTMNKLPKERKEFVIKLITLRIEKLMSIIQ
jgi:hypothetical protein